MEPRFSDQASFFKQEHEWARLDRGWVLQRSLSELAVVPELEPFEVVGPLANVVLVAVVLEVELLVAPQGRGRLRAGDDPPHESLRRTVLRRAVVAEDLEHGSVSLDQRELVVEVVLIGIRPAVHVVRFDVDLERPVRLGLLVAVLVKLGQLHD